MFEVNNDTGLVRMYGEIGDYFEDGVSERDVIRGLDGLDGRDIEIMLKSDGGDVFQGLSIFNALNNYAGNVTITIDGIAASIASVIAMAGDEIAIHENSMLFVHNPWTVAIGDSNEFRGVADLLDKIAGEIARVYDNKSGSGVEHFLAVMEADTYFTAAEALEEGLVDRVIPGKKSSKAPDNLRPGAVAAAFPRRIAAKHRLRRSRL